MATARCASSSTGTPPRGQAGTADHPQARRRIRLPHNRSRTIQTRVSELGAHRVLYVRRPAGAAPQDGLGHRALAGWLPDDRTPVHIQIGNVLEDRWILRTRSGSSLRLMACSTRRSSRRARSSTRSSPTCPGGAGRRPQVGIGAVKYADLSVAHNSEYVFDLDRTVSLTGNTGPYLQYVVARVRSIFRQAGLEPADPACADQAQHATRARPGPTAARLRGHRLGGRVVAEPHRLSGYLFELAQAFSAFLRELPRPQGRDRRAPPVAPSRSARSCCGTMTTGLDLLGVESPEQM